MPKKKEKKRVYKNALLINPFGIGDCLFTTPVIKSLKQALPEIKLSFLCNRRSAYILENNPLIERVFIYDRDEFERLRKQSFLKWLKRYLFFLHQIREAQCDLAVDFSLNSQYGFFCWYAGIKTRIGYDYRGRAWFLNKKQKIIGYNDKHVVRYYIDILKLIGLELEPGNLEFYLNQNDIAWADDFLKKNGVGVDDLLVAIVPGAGGSWGRVAHLKHWPVENFASLADKIIENYKAKIIILGDLAEKEIADSLSDKIKNGNINLAGATTVGQFSAILSKVKLAITNDGGPMHMATALGVDTVSVFGPVDERVYGPYPLNEHHLVVKAQVSCRPCYQKFRMPSCERNRECLLSIKTEEVLAAVRRLL